MNKIIIFVIIAIVVVGGFFLLNQQSDVEGTIPPEVTQDANLSPQGSPGDIAGDVVGEGEEGEETHDHDHSITRIDSGFSPKELTVGVGETVTFVNESLQDTWPASLVHPTHTVYPGSDIQKCFDGDSTNDSTIFDACRGLAPGESWSFTFDEEGTWDYHDHLAPSNFGTIIVQ